MNIFRCKQFSVLQDGVAMRVNTDGMLLGAWAPLPKQAANHRVLDIGTGSGIIALMLAQRLSAGAPPSPFIVDALEPHPSSAQAALLNFRASPWTDHLHVFCCSLQDYTSPHTPYFTQVLYDLMISNPPYFEDSLPPPDTLRLLTRHAISLPPNVLLKGVSHLLHPDGLFCVILPKSQQDSFCQKALEAGLFLRHETTVYSVAHRPPKRVLMSFAKREESLQSDTLVIHDGDVKSYTADYKKLTRDFYLAF